MHRLSNTSSFESLAAEEQGLVEQPRTGPRTYTFMKAKPGPDVEFPCGNWEETMRLIIRDELSKALARGPAAPVASDERLTKMMSGMFEDAVSRSQVENPPKRDAKSPKGTKSPESDKPSELAHSKTAQDSELDGLDELSTLKRVLARADPYRYSTWNPLGGNGMLQAFFQRVLSFIGWWAQLKEPEREGLLYDFVEGARFQSCIAVVIALNSVFMGIATDYEIEGTQVSPFLQGAELFFTVTYSVELSLKVFVHQQYFFCNENMHWNIFDAFLVGVSAYDILMDYILGGGKGFNAGFMRSLRVLRAGKVLRIFRLVRAISQLRLILNVLIGSMTALFWSLVMMVIMYYICGLVFVQGTAAHFEQTPDIDPLLREDLVTHFGSVGQAMLTLFMATTGGQDWVIFYNALSDVGVMYNVLYLCYIAFTVVAFFNVLTALFVEHAIEIAKPDRDDVVLLKRHAKMLEAEQLTKVLEDADTDGTGKISVTEFAEQMEDCQSPLRVYLEADGIDVADAALFFSLLKSCCESAHGEEDVDIKAFVLGLMKIRGGATSLDMQALVWQTQLIYRTMAQHFQVLEDMLHGRELKLAKLYPSKSAMVTSGNQEHSEARDTYDTARQGVAL